MRALRRRLHAVQRGGDRGSALVEFVSVGMLMLVPLVYLLVTVSRLQAASFAAEGGAREAVRVLVTAPDEETGVRRAQAAVLVAVRDQGFDTEPVLAVDCEQTPCLQPEARVGAQVSVEVVLPGVPLGLHRVVPSSVTVRATSTGVVDRFRP